MSKQNQQIQKQKSSGTDTEAQNKKATYNQESKIRTWFNKNKKIVSGVLLIVLVLAVGYLNRDLFFEEEIVVEEERPLVEVTNPEIQDIEKKATVIGSVDPTERRIIVPEVAGEVKSLYVEEGDYVSHGDLLMELDDGDYQLQLEEAQANLDGAKAQLENAKKGARTGERKEAETSVERAREAKEQMERELERVETLHQDGYASDQELEQMTLQYKNAKEQLRAAEGYKQSVEEGARDEELDALRSQIKRAETGVKLAERMIDRTKITAPVDGEITMVDAEEGELVGSESPAFVMLDPDSYQVLAGLPESYVNQVSDGETVDVKIPSALDEEFEGMIHHVGQLPPEENAKGYPMEIELTPEIEKQVRAGMYTQVNVTIEKSEDALAIPQHAVVEEEGETGVFIVDESTENQQVQFIEVKTGINEDGYIEIVSGLSEDDLVIIEGFQEIEQGIRVDATEMGDDS
ncbi:efflux RND transporter periplasmic adaptor subunit [Natranaerobius thermophilus]|uniref:Efflux transporter, RND family, MFP subunit n=1 Tax=Natranaerobius thermophilus (strain ATCC BAA-1301 / DSM 18059 / JW/NM-WN-LF) TaxID=457570 RepID=B2A6H6_NATTJ|nr:efflux RND transporter periplasmic adaptor subunit [Natranaerobius thermophilus]ACB85509.1 efflux transporter, RND family, MFP subunit [Natranaerobius thermophilus JW/NM-WN-LF]